MTHSGIAWVVALGLVAVGATAHGAPLPSAFAQDPQQAEAAARQQEREERARARDAAREARAARQAAKASKGGHELVERHLKTFRTGANTVLVLSNIAGDVTVGASGGDEVKLEAIKRVHGANEADAKRQLEATRLHVEERAGRVEARVVYPRHAEGEERESWKDHRVSVDYIVSAPVGSKVDVRSVSGDIVVDGIRGMVQAETVSGDVAATGLASGSTLKSVTGDVTVAASTVDGDLTTQSVSGDVHVKNFKARALTAGAVSGSVTLDWGSCERAVARSVSGDVEMVGSLVKGGRYEFKSHSGNIRLLVDGKTGFELDASSFSGAIRTELPMSRQNQSGGDVPGHPNRNVRAVFGDGSAQVEAASFSGNIVVGKPGKNRN